MQNHVGAIDYLLKLPQLTSVYPGTIMLEKCTKDELLSLVKKQAAWPDVMHKQFEKYWISILPLLLSCKQKCEIRHLPKKIYVSYGREGEELCALVVECGLECLGADVARRVADEFVAHDQDVVDQIAYAETQK